MKKYFSHLSAPLVIIAILFAGSMMLAPQTAHAGFLDWASSATDLLLTPFGWIATLLMQIATLLTYLSGLILNYIVQYSVVDMKANIDKAAVNDAWRVIRDISNMGFIFVLLYAAIMTIIGQGQDNQKLIVKIVVVAILVNFSLFFTKFVIDVSNILAMTFYDAIAPGVLNNTSPELLSMTGISNSLMEPLKITSLYNVEALKLEGKTLIIIAVMGTIVSLVAAFVFFAISILFVIRFVVLIFVLVLSPIAFVSFVLPQMDKYRKQWTDALIGQAFFAPIYFMLTWIVIVVSRGLFKSDASLATSLIGTIGPNGQASASPSSIGVLVNFIIMIALLIASLTTAKEWAGRLPGGAGKLIGAATGFAGGATLGVAGRFGRGTIGRAGAGLASSGVVKNMVEKGGAAGAAGRLAMLAGNKSAKSSWDLRASGISSQLGAGKAAKGGFMGDEKARQKAAAQRAKDLEPNDEEKAKLQGIEDRAMQLAGYNKPQSLTDAETREKASRQRLPGENDRSFNNRRNLEKANLKAEQDADRIVRQQIAAQDENARLAMEANQRAQKRPAVYADRVAQATVKIPTLPGEGRFETIKTFNETMRGINKDYLNRGVGGTVGQKLRAVGQQWSVEGNRRTGGFLDAVGRTLALRQSGREALADKAREYEKTLKKAKGDELAEKVKKAIEKEDGGGEEAPPKEEKPTTT